ncbi:type II toxin-antitoxin system VapC family toxin [soil metagenome]
MTIVVVDASVVVKWFLPEADSKNAERLLASDKELHAPDLLRLEVANAFWKHVLQKTIDRTLWELARPKLERSIGQWHESGPLLTEAGRLACDAAHPIYDFVYLALAQRLGAPFVTADRRFLAKAPMSEVIALENWKP